MPTAVHNVPIPAATWCAHRLDGVSAGGVRGGWWLCAPHPPKQKKHKLPLITSTLGQHYHVAFLCFLLHVFIVHFWISTIHLNGNPPLQKHTKEAHVPNVGHELSTFWIGRFSCKKNRQHHAQLLPMFGVPIRNNCTASASCVVEHFQKRLFPLHPDMNRA